MQKHFLKFRKVFTNIACSPLILISNNAELLAKHLPDENKQSITTLEKNESNKELIQGIGTKQEKVFLIAENEENIKASGQAGPVTVTVNGKMIVEDINISDSIELSAATDLIMEATNTALHQVQLNIKKELLKMSENHTQ